MTDSYRDPQQRGRSSDGSRENRPAGFRGGRGPGNREGGGFKIRLSENEMRSTRALQDAFNLRSPVAVLGFAVRTLGQMLQEGKLDELVAQHRSQDPPHARREGRGPKGRFSNEQHNQRQTEARPDPFARPTKPKPATSEKQESSEVDISQKEVGIEQSSSPEEEQESSTTNNSQPSEEPESITPKEE